MDIIHPDEHTFPLVQAFLEPHEEKCVLLCSHVRRHSEKIFIITDNKKADGHKGCPGTFITASHQPVTLKEHLTLSDILAVLYIDSTLFHYIPDVTNPQLDSTALYSFIKKEMNGKKIKCVSGETKGTDYFINLLKNEGREAYQINEYSLMEYGRQSSAYEKIQVPQLYNDDQIIRCTENDIEELFQIQKQYLQEEVAPKGKIVSDLEVKISLRQILKNQLCLGLFSEGQVVAKANTNAIGINWIQIGGVYTAPLYRRNGYAQALIQTICRRGMKVGKKIALFVKEKNMPALELYKKLGFTPVTGYTIAYFK